MAYLRLQCAAQVSGRLPAGRSKSPCHALPADSHPPRNHALAASATAQKKSFKLQLRQAAGFNDTKKQDWALLGMPADADWVL